MTINELDETRIELIRVDGHGWALYTPTSNYYLFHETHYEPAPRTLSSHTMQSCQHTGGDPCDICWNCSRNLIGTPNGPCPSCGEPPCR